MVPGSPAGVAPEAQAREGSHPPPEAKIWRPQHWEGGEHRRMLQEEAHAALQDQIECACNTGRLLC